MPRSGRRTNESLRAPLADGLSSSSDTYCRFTPFREREAVDVDPEDLAKDRSSGHRPPWTAGSAPCSSRLNKPRHSSRPLQESCRQRLPRVTRMPANGDWTSRRSPWRSAMSRVRQPDCCRRFTRAVCRCRRYAGAGEHCHPRKLRLAGQHDYLQPNSHTRHADAIELIAGHARPDERTRLSRGSRRSSDGAQSSWSADQNALGSAWIAAGTGCW